MGCGNLQLIRASSASRESWSGSQAEVVVCPRSYQWSGAPPRLKAGETK